MVQSRNEVVFALALGREDVCNMAYVWDTTRDQWSIRELPEITHTTTGIVPQYAPNDTWDNDAGHAGTPMTSRGTRHPSGATSRTRPA